MGLDGFPDDLKIDMAVVMDDAVTHADNLVKGDAGKLGARLGRQARSRFSGDKDAPQDGILRLAGPRETVRSFARRRSSE